MTEKQWYAWATPSGPINLMKAEDMPVKRKVCQIICDGNNYGQCDCDRIEADYWNALQAAKKSSVPIQNEIVAVSLIAHGQTILDIEKAKAHYCKPDTIYGPFNITYELQPTCDPGVCNSWETCYQNKRCMAQVAILYDDTEKDHYTVLKEFADKMSKQEDIPKDIQAVVNKRFWDMLDTPEKEESQEEGIRLLEKCDRTFESLRKIVIVLKEAEPEKLPELVHNIEIDFQGIQAVIRDYTRKQ